MSTLLLRLAAPLQSWGSNSKFDNRFTDMEPTKSGVIGMLACALGITREESLQELTALKYGVRIDQEGELSVDFHMVHEQKAAKNTSSWVTRRYYLADAVFLVGLEGPQEILEKIEQALENPVFPIYLGRRSCPPAGQVVWGIRNENLLTALREEPWLASEWYQRRIRKTGKDSLEVVRDAEQHENDAYSVRDLPVTFSQIQRKYNFRNVIRERVPLKNVDRDFCLKVLENDFMTKHNPMALLEDDDVFIEN